MPDVKRKVPDRSWVGILVYHKVGAAVQRGDVLFTITNDATRLRCSERKLKESVGISEEKCVALPLFYGVL